MKNGTMPSSPPNSTPADRPVPSNAIGISSASMRPPSGEPSTVSHDGPIGDLGAVPPGEHPPRGEHEHDHVAGSGRVHGQSLDGRTQVVRQQVTVQDLG